MSLSCLFFVLYRTHTLHTHWSSTLSGPPCFYRLEPTFAFKTADVLHGLDSTTCWTHLCEILLHVDKISSLHLQTFVRRTLTLPNMLFYHIPRFGQAIWSVMFMTSSFLVTFALWHDGDIVFLDVTIRRWQTVVLKGFIGPGYCVHCSLSLFLEDMSGSWCSEVFIAL